jgi:hypothetical protein
VQPCQAGDTDDFLVGESHGRGLIHFRGVTPWFSAIREAYLAVT